MFGGDRGNRIHLDKKLAKHLRTPSAVPNHFCLVADRGVEPLIFGL